MKPSNSKFKAVFKVVSILGLTWLMLFIFSHLLKPVEAATDQETSPAVVYGTLIGSDGELLDDYTDRRIYALSRTSLQEAVTLVGPDGRFSLTLEPGDWTILAGNKYRPSTSRPWADYGEITLEGGQFLNDYLIEVPLEKSLLTGRIVDEAGNLISRGAVDVIVHPAAGSVVHDKWGTPLLPVFPAPHYSLTVNNGIFTQTVPPGRYLVSLNGILSGSKFVEVSAGTSLTVDIPLESRGFGKIQPVFYDVSTDEPVAIEFGTEPLITAYHPNDSVESFGNEPFYLFEGDWEISITPISIRVEASSRDDFPYDHPPAVYYVADSVFQIPVEAGESQTVSFPLIPVNAEISGTFSISDDFMGDVQFCAHPLDFQFENYLDYFVINESECHGPYWGPYEDGFTFHFESLYAGDWVISAFSTKFTPYEVAEFTLEAGQIISDAHFELTPPSEAITGTFVALGFEDRDNPFTVSVQSFDFIRTNHHNTARNLDSQIVKSDWINGTSSFSIQIPKDDTIKLEGFSLSDDSNFDQTIWQGGVTLAEGSLPADLRLPLYHVLDLPYAKYTIFRNPSQATEETIELNDGFRATIRAGSDLEDGIFKITAAPNFDFPASALYHPLGYGYQLIPEVVSLADTANALPFGELIEVSLPYDILSPFGSVEFTRLRVAAYSPASDDWVILPINEVEVDENLKTMTVESDQYTKFALVLIDLDAVNFTSELFVPAVFR